MLFLPVVHIESSLDTAFFFFFLFTMKETAKGHKTQIKRAQLVLFLERERRPERVTQIQIVQNRCGPQPHVSEGKRVSVWHVLASGHQKFITSMH